MGGGAASQAAVVAGSVDEVTVRKRRAKVRAARGEGGEGGGWGASTQGGIVREGGLFSFFCRQRFPFKWSIHRPCIHPVKHVRWQ